MSEPQPITFDELDDDEIDWILAGCHLAVNASVRLVAMTLYCAMKSHDQVFVHRFLSMAIDEPAMDRVTEVINDEVHRMIEDLAAGELGKISDDVNIALKRSYMARVRAALINTEVGPS